MWGWETCVALALALQYAHYIWYVVASLLQKLQEIILLYIILIACYTIASFPMLVKYITCSKL